MIQRSLQNCFTTTCDRAARAVNLTALLSLGLMLTGTMLTKTAVAPAWAAIDAVPLPKPVGPQLADGVYLYGEAQERDQLNRAYMVFEVSEGKVEGAVYWPQSNFNCIDGRFANQQLALRVSDTYTQESYTYSLGLTQSTALLASRDLETVPLEVGLEGMHRIAELNDNDLRILKMCQANL